MHVVVCIVGGCLLILGLYFLSFELRYVKLIFIPNNGTQDRVSFTFFNHGFDLSISSDLSVKPTQHICMIVVRLNSPVRGFTGQQCGR